MRWLVAVPPHWAESPPPLDYIPSDRGGHRTVSLAAITHYSLSFIISKITPLTAFHKDLEKTSLLFLNNMIYKDINHCIFTRIVNLLRLISKSYQNYYVLLSILFPFIFQLYPYFSKPVYSWKIINEHKISLDYTHNQKAKIGFKEPIVCVLLICIWSLKFASKTFRNFNLLFVDKKVFLYIIITLFLF